MKNEPLITIIVPIFNMKIYLKRCLDSISTQTYKNIEIILVDDGSTDGSAEICDEYKNQDVRFKVIHQKNGGLSVARNSGLDVAQGKYILFIDSDDWIKDNMVQLLYEAVEQTNSDLAVCGFILTDGVTEINSLWYDNSCVFTREQAYEELISNTTMQSQACNKIYKAEIIKSVYFPKGELFEDIQMMHKVFRKCEKIAVISDRLYYYYTRQNSISFTPKLYNRLALSLSLMKRLEYVETYTPQYKEKVLAQAAKFFAQTIIHYSYSAEEITNNQQEYEYLKNILNQKETKRAIYKYCNLKDKIQYIFAVFSPKLGNYIYRNFYKYFS